MLRPNGLNISSFQSNDRDIPLALSQMPHAAAWCPSLFVSCRTKSFITLNRMQDHHGQAHPSPARAFLRFPLYFIIAVFFAEPTLP